MKGVKKVPIYTYICKDCGEKFELLLGVGTADEEKKCKKCNSKNVEKTISSFNTVSKSSSSSNQSCPTGTCGLGD